MAFSERSLDDYVDVAQRIADFREQYPTGSLQPADPAEPWSLASAQSHWCIRCVGARAVKAGRDSWKTCPRCDGTGLRSEAEPVADTFVVYVAAAYRTPDDPRPGIGVAWEPYPGRTPYTAGSELQNAETSAWGRAIVAVLASDTKQGVASRQEVAARRAERDDGLPTNADGSLSRSRTTDAEKDAAGVMTSAQQAEHTKLQPKRAETRGRVTRITGQDLAEAGHPGNSNPWPNVPADHWQDQPAGQLPEETEREPGSISPQQQRAIHAACTGMDRAKRIATISDIVGRQVTSSNELSYTEAARVLGKLSGAPA